MAVAAEGVRPIAQRSPGGMSAEPTGAADFCIEALPGTVPPGEEPKWPPCTADEYLQERLREIKLV